MGWPWGGHGSFAFHPHPWSSLQRQVDGKPRRAGRCGGGFLGEGQDSSADGCAAAAAACLPVGYRDCGTFSAVRCLAPSLRYCPGPQFQPSILPRRSSCVERLTQRLSLVEDAVSLVTILASGPQRASAWKLLFSTEYSILK